MCTFGSDLEKPAVVFFSFLLHDLQHFNGPLNYRFFMLVKELKIMLKKSKAIMTKMKYPSGCGITSCTWWEKNVYTRDGLGKPSKERALIVV